LDFKERIMKVRKTPDRVLIFLAILAISLFSNHGALADGVKPSKPGHEEITQQLIAVVDGSPEVKYLLVKSIEKAKKVNPDAATNPARTLEEYYDFIDWAVKALPWTLLPKLPCSMLYDRMDQGLAYFYFINDQPLDELKGKGYYRNSLQYHEPYRTWLVNFVKDWGIYLSTEDSWSDEYYRIALSDDRFGLSKGWYEDPSNWKSFNDFFSRRLSSPDKRPVAKPDDPLIVSSPGDSTPAGVWKIDKNSNIAGGKGVQIKSKSYKSIESLLGPDSACKNAFAGGTMLFEYLDEYDYHRCHFPVSGTIKEARVIRGGASSGGVITWDSKSKRYLFDPGDPGWQSLETRGCIIVDSGKTGLVALLPVGMSQVASVVLEDNVKVGNRIKKGDKLCHYLFGGSGFVMLFQKEAGFKLTAPSNEDGTYRHILAGEELGSLRAIK
jgi:phosphatidylserine decarboxylase